MINLCICVNPSLLPPFCLLSCLSDTTPMRTARGFTCFQLYVEREILLLQGLRKSQDQVSPASSHPWTITGVTSTTNTPKTRPESEEGVILQGKYRSDSERKERMMGREQNKCKASSHVHSFIRSLNGLSKVECKRGLENRYSFKMLPEI